MAEKKSFVARETSEEQLFVVCGNKPDGGGPYYKCSDGYVFPGPYAGQVSAEAYMRPILLFSSKESAQKAIDFDLQAPRVPLRNYQIKPARPEFIEQFVNAVKVPDRSTSQGQGL